MFLLQDQVTYLWLEMCMQIEDPLTLQNMKSEGMANNHKTQPCVSSSTVRREQRATKKAMEKVSKK